MVAQVFYNSTVKSWDAIIIGGGIIGLSLAISLRKQGLHVLVVERGEPGREASSAAAGMIVGDGCELPLPLRALAAESARMYPEFVHEIEDESGLKVDLRDQGTILISKPAEFPQNAQRLSNERLQKLEPAIRVTNSAHKRTEHPEFGAAYLNERSVDPRALVEAAAMAARHGGVDISSGSEVKAVLTCDGRVSGAQTEKTTYSAEIVVNCAGAWAGRIAPEKFPVRPVKGQMLAVVGGPGVRHVVRGSEVYLVPHSDGRIVIGSTLEDAGYNKQVDVNTIQRLFQAAVQLVPALSKSKRHEDWSGLRPGTPDELPLLGETATRGYFVASGHYRDGILLAPVTAKVVSELILNRPCSHDLSPFSPARF
jgi:glycine oxidase